MFVLRALSKHAGLAPTNFDADPQSNGSGDYTGPQSTPHLPLG